MNAWLYDLKAGDKVVKRTAGLTFKTSYRVETVERVTPKRVQIGVNAYAEFFHKMSGLEVGDQYGSCILEATAENIAKTQKGAAVAANLAQATKATGVTS